MTDRPDGLASRAVLLAQLFCDIGCSTEAAPRPSAPPPVVAAAAALSPTRVTIPGGSFSAGSEPRRFQRDPWLEPRLDRVALGPFEIDVLPYSADGHGPLLGVGREEALQRCGDRGGRLCTELEWERACKGPHSQPFPSGVALAPDCGAAPGCASGFGVWGFGLAPEWTSSNLPGRSEHPALVRGARSDAPASLRRCAHRESRAPDPAPGIAFRCCYGPPNAARVLPPRLGASFGTREIAAADLAHWLAADPATAELGRDVTYFPEAASLQEVLARGSGNRQGHQLTTTPLSWNPAAGVDLLVVAARSGPSTSFVVVFDVLGDGAHHVAASFIMEDEPGPVALAYDGSVRQRLQFSTCWGCPGESGKIVYRDTDETVISQP